jgi:hypothetical protein
VSTPQQTVDVTTFAGPLLEKFLALKAALAADDGATTITEADIMVLLDEIRASAVEPAMAQILATVPGAAEMPPEDLSTLVGEALAEVVMEAINGKTA